MRDRPNSNQNLQWPGGIVPEWAKASNNPNNRRRKHRGKGGQGRGGGGGNSGGGGSSPGKRERLQKVMAQSGHGSRRNIEILIAQGHITINGQVAKLGDLVGPGDKVKLDGALITLRFGETLPQVLLYHKPEGEIVTRDDPEGRATVFEKLPRVQGGRWVSVGRLDLNTGGLLIFTTNGELANRLMHPRFEVEREYALRLLGEMTDECRAKLLAGVDLEGESCKFESIEDRGGDGANKWYHVVLKEGKNREVRRMCESVGLTVSRLLRVRFGPVHMPAFLKRGMMKALDEQEVAKLVAFAGMNQDSLGGHEHEEDDDDSPPLLDAGPLVDPDPEDPPQPIDPRQAQPHQHHQQNHQNHQNQQPRHRPHGQGHGHGQGQGQGPGQGQPGGGNRQGKPGGKHNKRGKHRNKPHGQPGQQGRQGQQVPPVQPGGPQGGQPIEPGQQMAQPHAQGQPGQGQKKHHGGGQRNKQRHRGARGDEQPRYIPPKGDEQPRYIEPAEKDQRGDEQPLTNENRRVW